MDASPWPLSGLSASNAVVVAGDVGAAVVVVDVGVVADDEAHAEHAANAVVVVVVGDDGIGVHVVDAAAADENAVERGNVNVAVADGAEGDVVVADGAAVAVAVAADDACVWRVRYALHAPFALRARFWRAPAASHARSVLHVPSV